MQVVAHLAGRVADVIGVAGAELAERARAPALQLAVVEHHARVVTAIVAGRARHATTRCLLCSLLEHLAKGLLLRLLRRL